MKKTDLKEKSSVFIIGRGFIIIAIFITSSLSFTLGYFVGKSSHSHIENKPLSTPQQERIEQKNIVPEMNESQETGLTKETAETKMTQETTKTQEKPKTSKKIKYTVQVGAFKDAAEANELKTRLDKKGYKAYVVQSESKKGKQLYKVRIGEFSTKKEAELLSIKIRKAEGLQTFATFKTEQEDLR